MREVLPNRLWIGNGLDARNPRRLYELEIVAVVDLAVEEPPAQLGREMVYARFPLSDGAGNAPVVLRAAIDLTAHFLRSEIPLLVACGAGMSRSPAVVAAALAQIRQQPFDDCLAELVAGQPHDVSPLLWNDIRRLFPSREVS